METKTSRLMVVLGRVSCPRGGEVEVASCLSCRWFDGLIQDRHPLLECAFVRRDESAVSAAEIPGRYLG